MSSYTKVIFSLFSLLLVSACATPVGKWTPTVYIDPGCSVEHPQEEGCGENYQLRTRVVDGEWQIHKHGTGAPATQIQTMVLKEGVPPPTLKVFCAPLVADATQNADP